MTKQCHKTNILYLDVHNPWMNIPRNQWECKARGMPHRSLKAERCQTSSRSSLWASNRQNGMGKPGTLSEQHGQAHPDQQIRFGQYQWQQLLQW